MKTTTKVCAPLAVIVVLLTSVQAGAQDPEFRGKIGKTFIPQTVPATFSIEETFDVGEDTGSPVIEDVYAVAFRCEALQKLTVKREDD
jgi:hypothetical protein